MFILRCLVPIYVEVKLDKSLKFVTTVWHRIKKFFLCPVAEITCGPRAGAGAQTSDTLLFLVYSIAQCWNLICSGSARTWFIRI